MLNESFKNRPDCSMSVVDHMQKIFLMMFRDDKVEYYRKKGMKEFGTTKVRYIVQNEVTGSHYKLV